MFDFSHPFFRPVWLRIVVVSTAVGWAVFEALTGAVFWAIVFGALGAAAAWGLLIDHDPGDPGASRKEDKE